MIARLSRLRLISLVTGFVLGLVVSAPAPGQAPLASLTSALDDVYAADFARRDMAKFHEALWLDPSQTAIVESLIDDYEASLKAGADALRAQMGKIAPLMGGENPQIEQRRNDLKARIAQLVEQAQQAEAQAENEAQAEEAAGKFEEQARAVQEEMRQLEQSAASPEQLAAAVQQAVAHLNQWHLERRGLRDKFIGDLQALLDDSQRQRWPALERRLLREKTMNRGRLSGESIDLVALVRELDLDESAQAAIAGPLNDYEVALEAALRARNDHISSTHGGLIKATHQRDDTAAALAIERQTELRVAVRNVNDEWAQTIAAGLDAENAQRLIKLHRQRGYPRIFRPTHAQRLLTAARELTELDDAQTAALRELQQAYLVELAVANEGLLSVVRAQEPAEFTHRQLSDQRGSDAQTGSTPSASIQEAFTRRAELDRRTVDQLRALLPADQFAQLPHQGAEPPNRDADNDGG